MPTPAVFSYWRRDHRRSAAPQISLPTGPSPDTNGAEIPLATPPQLPEIPDTPNIEDAFSVTPSYEAPLWGDSPLDNDPSKLNPNSSSTPVPLSPSASLAVPSPLSEKENRPHSSPEEYLPETTIMSQSNNSQLSVSGLRPDQGDGEPNSKPNSPFRLSFKGPRALQSEALGIQKRSPTAGPGTNHFRWKTSPDEWVGEKATTSQRESKQDREAIDNAHHKSGKAMLHLLNPMSLLARRRSSQISGSRVEDTKMNASNLVPAIPDDYDPRIRGNIVHDFSAPRPSRRNVSGNSGEGNVSGAQDLSPGNRWSDQSKPYCDHSPVFKEHFEDDKNALQVENKGYLQSTLLTTPAPHGYEKSIPVFAKNLPSTLPDQADDSTKQQETLPEELPKEVPVESSTEAPIKDSPAPKEPRAPVVQPDQDAIPIVPHPASSLPKHLKSNASSRFSFDMGGVESSVQEKLLEERHKEHKAKEAQRKLEDDYFDDFDEDFDQDMMDGYDDLEEKIPGVNADYDDEDDEFSAPTVSRDINGELKSWTIPGLSPVIASPITPAPPEIPTNTVGSDHFAPAGLVTIQKEAPQPEQSAGHDPQVESPPVVETVVPKPTQLDTAPQGEVQLLSDDDDDDDLYFDDGEFGDLGVDDQDGGFDESIFDDPTSHLYDRKTVDKTNEPQPSETNDRGYDEILEEDVLQEANVPQGLKHMPSVASEYGVGTVKRGPLGDPIPNMGPARAHGGVLTEQNLEVLHNALAFAAHESVGQNRFERTMSTSNRSLGQESISQPSHTDDSQPGLISDDSRLSHIADMLPYDGFQDDYFYDGDGYFDDPIIAAANAEALENDDEGFYGQEFGFYAQAHDPDGSELTNGGYFGPRGKGGISRSFSSRGKFQEPSLTPITERSEWSTRNSIISVKTPHGGAHSNPALASPGLAQLVDMGNLDDEMSLSALMKLRRGAWGGSNGSLRSSAGSPQPHTLPSSNRGSFTGPSDASPSDFRQYPEDVQAGISSPREEGHLAVPAPKDNGLGASADLPLRGPTSAGYDEELPNAGASQHLNVL